MPGENLFHDHFINREAQKNRRTLKKFPEQVSKLLATRDRHDYRPVLIMTQDEGRFGRISDPKACWVPAGIRPIVPKQIVREFLYVYAAVAPALGKMSALLLPYANTYMMNIFLRLVSQDFDEFYVVMVVDRAGWHSSSGLDIPENIEFIEQPSHSPEVNPTEHLWDEIREKDFHNTAFDSMKKLEDHLCKAIVKIQDDPTRLRSLTNFPYLRCDSFLKNLGDLVPI
jgi:hypothetical protein